MDKDNNINTRFWKGHHFYECIDTNDNNVDKHSDYSTHMLTYKEITPSIEQLQRRLMEVQIDYYLRK